MKKSFQSGQIGLVVLLVASVLLTLGIGIASQSVLETKTATQETDSSKILNVTERAIERALRNLTSPDEDYGVPLTISEQVNSFETQLYSGDVAQLDVEGSTILNLSWTKKADCSDEPAIVVTLIGTTTSSVWRGYFDGCTLRGTNALTPSCSGLSCGVSVDSLEAVSGYKLARIKVLYSSGTTLRATLNNDVAQSYIVSAEGNDEQTGETRSVTAVRSNPAVPPIFDYALYSGSGDISQ